MKNKKIIVQISEGLGNQLFMYAHSFSLYKRLNYVLEIDNIRLLIKEGVKSGLWTNPDGLPKFLKDIF